jgi:2-polyprenyl-3-methyl-5-hydroxy-6-metoxy-1,4-benzoquinol methylase
VGAAFAEAGEGWLPSELEYLGTCPVCRSPERASAHAGLRDRLHPKHPGSWDSWRCVGCGSVYVDPRPTPAAIGRVYESYYTHEGGGSGEHEPSGLRARLLDGYLHRHFGYAVARASVLGWLAVSAIPGARAMASQHVRHLHSPVVGSARLLDIGCAAGGFLQRMERLGWVVCGVEPDPESRAIATRRGLRVYEGLAEAVEADAGPFDAITMSHSIEHMHDPVAVLAQCRPLLRPGGGVWVATPNADAYGHRRFGQWWAPLDSPRHLVLFTPHSLRLALKLAGFVHVEWPPATLQASAWTYGMSAALRHGEGELHPISLGWKDRLAAGAADLRTVFRRQRGEEVVAVGHCPSEGEA